MRHLPYCVSRVSPALLAAGLLLTLIAAISFPAPSGWAASGPFAGFAGSWSGTGTLRPSGGQAERIRCNANYRQRGSSEHQIDLQLRCASDSYNFDLTGQFSADDNNQINGQWTERTRNVGGTAVGNAQGERLQLHIESSGFAATLVMLTRNRRQSVSIDSQGGGQLIKASITLSRS
ncbi:hypothetical protein MXD81_55775 [Microbacteriaceae bacterium K1510]|nr:hypothetical protein [Microbacteriaceae bacterium K1510]